MIVDLEHLTSELFNWFHHSNVKAINVVTVPYRGVDPLAGLLEHVLGKVRLLYITGPAGPEESIERFLEARDIEFSHNEESEAPIIILDYDRAFSSQGHYDLVIYDDVNSFPTHRKNEMHELLNHIYYRTKKIIAYSLEAVFRNVINLELPLKENRSFVTEPRFIGVKGDIKTSVPSSVYEYINFFIRDQRSIVVFVPDDETAEGMKSYLERIDPALTKHMHDVSGLSIEEVRDRVLENKNGILLFTKQINDFREIPVNFEFIVADSSAKAYEYRQFIFLCLRNGLFDDLNGEVLLVSSALTYDMDRTQKLTQNYNRVIWENDQLFL